MRLIDADALKASIEEKDRYNLGGQGRIVVCGMLDDAPTIDAEPVRHGRWLSHVEYCKLHNYLPSGASVPFWCSECESSAKEKTLHCSHCGAKMDGGAENA